MIFKNWRTSDVSSINIHLNPKKIYLFSARSVGLKGYLGGSHTWFGFWSKENQQWQVIELTDHESLKIQGANVLFKMTDEFLKLVPFIVARDPRGRWFGAEPKIVDECYGSLDMRDLISYCQDYPFKDYKVLSQNCNSFTSFLTFKFYEKNKYVFKKPKIIVGHKSAQIWKQVLRQKPNAQPYSFAFDTQELQA